MAKILTMILFNLVGKFISERVLTDLVIKLIVLALKELKAIKVFKDVEREKRLDDIIEYVEEVVQSP